MTKALFVGFATLDIFGEEKRFGGAAGSMSRLASELGITSSLLAPLSTDEDGNKYLEALNSAGVDTSFCSFTSPSLPILNLANPQIQNAQTEFRDNGAIKAIDDINISLSDVDQFDVIFCANAHPNLLKILIPKLTTTNVFYIPGPQVTKHADYIESDIYPFCLGVFANPIETPYVVATKPLESGAQLFIQTLGSSGGKITAQTGEKYNFNAFELKDVKDTIGAGDAFALGFGVKYLETNDVNQAIEAGKQMAVKIIKTT